MCSFLVFIYIFLRNFRHVQTYEILLWFSVAGILITMKAGLIVDFAQTSRKRDRVFNISETSTDENHQVKPKAKPRVLHSSIPS